MVKNLIFESKFDFNIVMYFKQIIQCLLRLLICLFVNFTRQVKVSIDLHAHYAQVKVTVVAPPALDTLLIIVPTGMWAVYTVTIPVRVMAIWMLCQLVLMGGDCFHLAEFNRLPETFRQLSHLWCLVQPLETVKIECFLPEHSDQRNKRLRL